MPEKDLEPPEIKEGAYTCYLCRENFKRVYLTRKGSYVCEHCLNDYLKKHAFITTAAAYRAEHWREFAVAVLPEMTGEDKETVFRLSYDGLPLAAQDEYDQWFFDSQWNDGAKEYAFEKLIAYELK
jgi:hypothetical protein